MNETTTGETVARDFGICIGEKFYTPTEFVDEAVELGVSRRLPVLPDGLVFGRSVVWLVVGAPSALAGTRENAFYLLKRDPAATRGEHLICARCVCGLDAADLADLDEFSAEFVTADSYLRGTGSKCMACGSVCHKPPRIDETRQGRVIGFFVPDGVDLIVDDPAKVDEFATKYRVELVPETKVITETQARREAIRKCGRRHTGIYLVTRTRTETVQVERAIEEHPDLAALLGRADAYDLHGPVVLLREPLPYAGHHFRGIREIDAAELGLPVTVAACGAPAAPQIQVRFEGAAVHAAA